MELNKYYGFNSWEFYMSELDRAGVRHELLRCDRNEGPQRALPANLQDATRDFPECGSRKDTFPAVGPDMLLVEKHFRPRDEGCDVFHIISADKRAYYATCTSERDLLGILDAWGYTLERRSNLDTLPVPVVELGAQFQLAM